MKSTLAAVLAAGLISAAPAFAITIDFEGPTSFASIDQFYNGGTDSAGVFGPNLGASFGLDALGLQNDVLGPYFSNAPSPFGVMAPVGTDAAMNFAAGFNGLASIFYSSTDAAAVNIWSGLNGTGSILGAFTLTSNAQSGGCVDSPYCSWSLSSFDLGTNVARSITFGDATGLAGFDNVSVTAVPEPSEMALMAFGLAGMGAYLRRRKQAAA